MGRVAREPARSAERQAPGATIGGHSLTALATPTRCGGITAGQAWSPENGRRGFTRGPRAAGGARRDAATSAKHKKTRRSRGRRRGSTNQLKA